MEDDSERALVARLQGGDADAFDQVYQAYRARLFSFLARLCQRRDLAEDLLQETWLRLARSAHRLRDDTVLSAWLFTVARNLHASYRRWTLVELARRDALDSAGADAPDSPFELAAADELERRLERALASLAVTDREVLLLIAVEKLPHGEVARILGLRPAALRKRLSRARARLADALGLRDEQAASTTHEVPA